VRNMVFSASYVEQPGRPTHDQATGDVICA
jgi:hypothetical protein